MCIHVCKYTHTYTNTYVYYLPYAQNISPTVGHATVCVFFTPPQPIIAVTPPPFRLQHNPARIKVFRGALHTSNIAVCNKKRAR